MAASLYDSVDLVGLTNESSSYHQLLQGGPVPEPDTTTSTAGRRLVDSLVQASFAVQGVLAQVGAEHDVSLVLVRMLGVLRDRTLPMSEVAAHLGLDRSSVTGLVTRAEGRGLVRRSRNREDGRGVVVGLTAKGTRIVAAAEASVDRHLLQLTGPLTERERERLTSLLERMISPAAG
jgi:DNA-binding MarR family transcriptional regulator